MPLSQGAGRGRVLAVAAQTRHWQSSQPWRRMQQPTASPRRPLQATAPSSGRPSASHTNGCAVRVARSKRTSPVALAAAGLGARFAMLPPLTVPVDRVTVAIWHIAPYWITPVTACDTLARLDSKQTCLRNPLFVFLPGVPIRPRSTKMLPGQREPGNELEASARQLGHESIARSNQSRQSAAAACTPAPSKREWMPLRHTHCLDQHHPGKFTGRHRVLSLPAPARSAPSVVGHVHRRPISPRPIRQALVHAPLHYRFPGPFYAPSRLTLDGCVRLVSEQGSGLIPVASFYIHRCLRPSERRRLTSR